MVKSNNEELLKALCYGNTESVEKAIAAGADVNAKGNYGIASLHSVAVYGEIKIAEFLIKSGANVSAKDDYGSTPLHNAAISINRSKVVKLLIDNGADVNAQDNDGKTPLHKIAASVFHDVEAVKFLIDNGADIHAKDKNGRTPLDIAKQEKHQKVVEVIQWYVNHPPGRNFKDDCEEAIGGDSFTEKPDNESEAVGLASQGESDGE